MPDEDEKSRLTPTAREAYESKVKIPRKYCPYCGTRNPPNADICENCGKDISWIKVPEHTPYPVAPQVRRKPELPEKAFSRRTLIILLIALALVVGTVMVIIMLATPGKSAVVALPVGLAYAGLVASPMRSTPNLHPLRALYQSHISSPTRRTSSW